MSTLPDKPSELIRVALADFDKAMADGRFVFDMGSWMERMDPDGKCDICLAGSVMAMTLGLGSSLPAFGEFSSSACDFDEPLALKLEALSEFAFGEVSMGLSLLGLAEPTREPWRRRSANIDNPAAFRADMEKLAADLEEAGL